MQRYHHLGVPTTVARDGEYHIPARKVHVYDYRHSAYGVEWLRFEEGSDSPDLLKTVPHVAFEVDDLDAELVGKEVLVAPNSPSPGVRVAFIVENGAPVEFLEYDRATTAAPGEEHPVLRLEREALTVWARGNPDAFIALAANDIVYFDPFIEARIDGKAAFVAWMEKVRGTFSLDSFEINQPFVQERDGLAVLTFNFTSKGGGETYRWNATEVYRHE